MKKISLLLLASFLLSIAAAGELPSDNAGLVNNADLNRRMASNKQFPQDSWKSSNTITPKAKRAKSSNSSTSPKLVNNADLNRRMASNKQFTTNSSDTAVVTEEQSQNSATVNLKAASNKLF